MPASRRWQDYATMVFGVLVFISPFAFSETSHHLSTIGAYVLGALLLVSGIVAAATREPRRSLIVNAPGIAAVITFIAAVVDESRFRKACRQRPTPQPGSSMRREPVV